MNRGASRSAREVFAVFLRLGLTSFGGPVAHIGYFRRELVERRRWVTDDQFAHLLALCQFLPGPASSQLGFALGLVRAGWAGSLAAFVAFTLPSALLLFAFAALLPWITGPAGEAAIHGLKLVALAVVAHAVLGMARQLCPDRTRATIAAVAAAVLLATPMSWMQLVVIATGMVAGLLFCRPATPAEAVALELPHGPRFGGVLLAIFAALLAIASLAALAPDTLAAALAAFYRAGALVFGGGHVVLPLLQEAVVAPGLVGEDAFLAGYGAAQAVPGPLFTLAAYLGARLPGESAALGATLATLAIFLPGLLLVAASLPLWSALARTRHAASAVAGANAAVVGLLAAALYDPVWTSAVRSATDVGIAIIGFALLAAWRASAIVVVAWCVAASLAAALLAG